ncbi:MAG: methyltransferase domain-containing protein [Gemmatimonadota bacterium]
MKPGARVFDAGCGDGRNAVPLAHAGMQVDAVDSSADGIAKLQKRAQPEGLKINASVDDITCMRINGRYDLIVCHGVLHLFPRDVWLRLLHSFKAATAPDGFNIIAVFTDALPAAPDLAPFTHGPFREGELAALYRDWQLERADSYRFEDQHPGGIRHQHALNKIVARNSKPENRG